MGIPLTARFETSGFSATNKVILTAMKKYGMILANNGGYFYLTIQWTELDRCRIRIVVCSGACKELNCDEVRGAVIGCVWKSIEESSQRVTANAKLTALARHAVAIKNLVMKV